MVYVYILGSILAVSLLSVIAMLPLLLTKKISQKFLIALLSLSAGTLIGSTFIHFIPESIYLGYTLGVAINIVLGYLVFFIIESFVHWNHNHNHGKGAERKIHTHGYHLGVMNLIGDALHNFIDGLVIAGSYLVSVPLGIAATISILLHELPQEIADVGVLLYSGFNKKKVLLFNFMTAATAFIGGMFGIFLAGYTQAFNQFIIPFAAGVFLYIGATNLVPELHRHCSLKDSLIHIGAFALGVGIMIALVFLGLGHAH